MKIKDLFEKRNLTGLKIKTPILDLDWRPSDPNKATVWDLCVEVLTGITRETLKDPGRSCIQFAKIAIVVLNQMVRPFHCQMAPQKPGRGFCLSRSLPTIPPGTASLTNAIEKLHPPAGRACRGGRFDGH